jgi:hypothetical protein
MGFWLKNNAQGMCFPCYPILLHRAHCSEVANFVLTTFGHPNSTSMPMTQNFSSLAKILPPSSGLLDLTAYVTAPFGSLHWLPRALAWSCPHCLLLPPPPPSPLQESGTGAITFFGCNLRVLSCQVLSILCACSSPQLPGVTPPWTFHVLLKLVNDPKPPK